jgi:hypothetical protein
MGFHFQGIDRVLSLNTNSKHNGESCSSPPNKSLWIHDELPRGISVMGVRVFFFLLIF